MQMITLLLGLLVPFVSCEKLKLRDYNREGAAECYDEFNDCEQRVREGKCRGVVEGTVRDVKIIRHTLMVCRASCRAYLLKEYEEGRLPEISVRMINLAGGVGNLVLDPLGHFFEICNLEKGFDIRTRSNMVENIVLSEMAFLNVTGFTSAKRYTEKGIKKAKLPKNIFGDILDYRTVMERGRGLDREDCNPGVHWPCMLPVSGEDSDECTYQNQTGMEIMPLSNELIKALFNILRPEGEKWAGVPLVNSNVYGIRRYLRGAQLFAHIDHINTHVISCIINVAQKVDKPWPLEIVDFDRKVHKVLLKPREILWYESTKLSHGRPTPFEGEYFDNIFVHFRPKKEEDKEDAASNSPDNKLHIKF